MRWWDILASAWSLTSAMPPADEMGDLSPRDERRLEKVEEAVVKIPIVESELKYLAEEVHGIKRALWAVAGSIIVGVFIFALTIATGVLGGAQ